MTSEPLDQFIEICRAAFIKSTSAKLGKAFEKLLMDILLLYVVMQRRMNFTQMGRYGQYSEQTYRSNFNRCLTKCVNWLRFNLALAPRYLDMNGLLAIAIDPSYISKSGDKTPHVGRFWSGCAATVKHGLEILGLGLVDVRSNRCLMLRACQTPSTDELKLRNMGLVKHYVEVIGKYDKELIQVTDLVVADAFFSVRPFADGIRQHGFHLVSRFRDTAICGIYMRDPEQRNEDAPKCWTGRFAIRSWTIPEWKRWT